MNDGAACTGIDPQVLEKEGAPVADNAASAAQNVGAFTDHHASRMEDLKFLLPLAKAFHEESRFSHISFTEEKFYKAYQDALHQKNVVGIFVCLNGEPVGLIAGRVSEYNLGVGTKLATTFCYYIAPNVRHSVAGGRAATKLIRTFTDWAKQQGAQELHIHATVGIEPERVDRFF